MKVVHWLATENMPLSKYETLMKLLNELEVPGLGCLQIGNKIDYQSYYSANEMPEALSDVLDDETNEKIEKSPCVTIFADESTDITNTKRMTITARIIDPETSSPSTVYLRDMSYEDGTGEGLAAEIVKRLKAEIYL